MSKDRRHESLPCLIQHTHQVLGSFSAVCPQQHYTVVRPDGHPGVNSCHVRLPAHRRRRQSGKDRVQEVIKEPCCRVPGLRLGRARGASVHDACQSIPFSLQLYNIATLSVLYYKYSPFGQEKKCNILFICVKVTCISSGPTDGCRGCNNGRLIALCL